MPTYRLTIEYEGTRYSGCHAPHGVREVVRLVDQGPPRRERDARRGRAPGRAPRFQRVHRQASAGGRVARRRRRAQRRRRRRGPDPLPHRGVAFPLEDGAEARGVSRRGRARRDDGRRPRRAPPPQGARVPAERAAVGPLPRGDPLSRRDVRAAAAADRAGGAAMKEADIVARVRELFPQRGAKVGIGDDAAVVGEHVITTDMLIEDVDFTRAIPLRFVARKSLAVNLSDLAAMGALPAYALVALGLPPWTHEHIDELLEALASAARQYDVDLVGGDLSRAEKLTIAITAVGYVEHRPLLRSGARAGARVYPSRPIGGSAAGLWLLPHVWTVDGGPDVPYAQREFAMS